MLEALEPLMNSNVITGDTKKAIEEAWESKLAEVKEEAKTENLVTLSRLNFVPNSQNDTSTTKA